MSKLAASIKKVKADKPHIGPRPACYELYADCDREDLDAVQNLKNSGATWAQIQDEVDRVAGVTESLVAWRFIRHWREQCSCWREK